RRKWDHDRYRAQRASPHRYHAHRQQYWKSAELVVWLGQQLGIPMDKWYIWGHAEIDPTTTHKDCPKRALDWNTYFQAIADVQALAQGRPSMRLWTGI